MATRETREGEYTFDPTPLGMMSAFDSCYSPYVHGHQPPEAALDPVGYYLEQPWEYSYDPNAYYQWWHDKSEERKAAGGPPA